MVDNQYMQMFQFYDSPIKSISFFGTLKGAYSFNSMIVRLKEAHLDRPDDEIEVFQFYDSPIKRGYARRWDASRFWFQFYDSPIKRTAHHVDALLDDLFQFYDSPIKRGLLITHSLFVTRVSIL